MKKDCLGRYRAFLKARNKTIVNAVDEVGCSRAHLYRMLRGQAPLYKEWRDRLAAVIGLPEEAIFQPESLSNEERHNMAKQLFDIVQEDRKTQ